MKRDKLFKWRNMILTALILVVILSTSVHGYWVNQLEADCDISFKRDAVIVVTGLSAPDKDNAIAQTNEANPAAADVQTQKKDTEHAGENSASATAASANESKEVSDLNKSVDDPAGDSENDSANDSKGISDSNDYADDSKEISDSSDLTGDSDDGSDSGSDDDSDNGSDGGTDDGSDGSGHNTSDD